MSKITFNLSQPAPLQNDRSFDAGIFNNTITSSRTDFGQEAHATVLTQASASGPFAQSTGRNFLSSFEGFSRWEPPQSARSRRYENMEGFIQSQNLRVLGRVGNTVVVTQAPFNDPIGLGRVDRGPEARKDLNQSLSWLEQSPVGRELIQSMSDPATPKMLMLDYNTSKPRFEGLREHTHSEEKGKQVYTGEFRRNFDLVVWNPRGAQSVYDVNGKNLLGHLPPAIVLGHELGHLKNNIDNRGSAVVRIGIEEEMHVLRNYEHPLTRAFVLNGERPPVRQLYEQGREMVPVAGPLQMAPIKCNEAWCDSSMQN